MNQRTILQTAETAADLWRETRALARRAKIVAAAERRLDRERRRVEARPDALRAEVETLEARAAAARAVVYDPFIQPKLPLNADAAHWLRVSDALADQRALLHDVMQRFVAVHAEWERRRAESLQELDAHARSVEERAREVERRERRQAEQEAAARRIAVRLEAGRVRASAAWQAERAALAEREAQLEARERALEHRAMALADLYQRWGRRRRAEIDRLRHAQRALADAREEYTGWREHLRRMRLRLLEDQRSAMARQLAAQQLGDEIIEVAERPALAERRLERLRRRWQTWCAVHQRELERASHAIGAEADRLDHRAADVARRESELAEARAAVDAAHATIDCLRYEAFAARAAQREQREIRAQERHNWERQLADLRDQVDRLARLLIDPPAEAARAA